MRLNQASDFALRILMLLADTKKPMNVDTISNRLNLVKSHVMKIVAKLVAKNILASKRGRTGGVRLARPAEEISVGEVVRVIEVDFAVVECMRSANSQCVYAPACKLRGTVAAATDAFLAVLDKQPLSAISAAIPSASENLLAAD